MQLTPIPLLHVESIEHDGGLTVTALPACLELACGGKPLPTGWVLIRGRILHKSQNITFKLQIELAEPTAQRLELALPVSRKGIIQELISLPETAKKLYLAPQTAPVDFRLANLSIAPVTAPERIYRMLRRVTPAFGKYSRTRLASAGLHPHLPLTDLPRAYQIVSQFRGEATRLSYSQWLERFDTLSRSDRYAIRKKIRNWGAPPHFRIIVPWGDEDQKALMRTLDSLHCQLYRSFDASLLSTSSRAPLDIALLRRHRAKIASVEPPRRISDFIFTDRPSRHAPDWVIILPAGVALAEHALYWLADEIRRHKGARLLYADHDHYCTGNRRCTPVFKPDWSGELLRATNYIGMAATIRADMLPRSEVQLSGQIDNATFHDLLLRVGELLPEKAIRHIPAILWHAPEQEETHEANRPPAKGLVAEHLQRLGVSASTELTPQGHTKVLYALPASLPLVSIIIPTRNALDKLRPCVESVLHVSTYASKELLIVDNGSDDPETLAYLQTLASYPNIRVLSYPGPFNYSAINNFAAQRAKGDVLCFLNNDTEVITPEWLEVMLGYLVQPKVGAVGAKLLFADGQVQHAGVAVGPGGCANHLHVSLDRHDPGYCQRAILPQDISAVTAACMLTLRQLFLDSGGFDQVNLTVAFNDVDYCLRIRVAGFRVIWTPYAELYHYESISRGKDDTPEKIKRARREVDFIRKRWKKVIRNDPFYNPNLNYSYPDFSLSNVSLVKKPWNR